MDGTNNTSKLDDTQTDHACYSQHDLVVDSITAMAALAILACVLAAVLGAI